MRITAADRQGRPLAARLTMHVLFNGVAVGAIDNGAVYRFVGTWRERPGNEITWPVAARGQRLLFQAIVSAGGTTVKKSWWISVR